ncbi:MAG: hypothetical protein AAB660_01810 [Patescibacteria group bacterium]
MFHDFLAPLPLLVFLKFAIVFLAVFTLLGFGLVRFIDNLKTITSVPKDR